MNEADHDDPADYTWDNSQVIDVTLSGTSITVNPAVNSTVAGSKITITSPGTFRLSGSLTDGQVIVDAKGKGTVRLILNGVNIHCSNNAPIYVIDAKKTIIILQAGTQNYVSDGTSYAFANASDTEPNAAIFSKKDLTIYGTGSLNVDANYNDAIASKDGLIIKSGSVTATAVDDGVRGKDYLIVKDGNINLNVGGDGLKSDDTENVTKGYVSVENGVLNIVAGGDGVVAETDVIMTNGDLTVTSGGGSSSVVAAGASAKGIRGIISIIIDNGDFNLNSADDTIHSNGNITINGGSFALSTGDDGIHADTYVVINGGNINITKSYEGIEASVITINSGTIRINSSDDGINIAGGTDGAPADPFAPPAEGQWLHINGGYIVVSAEADGIDTNGYMDMSGGVVIINGPTDNMNAAIDYGSGTFKITGGTIVAVGSSGMAQGPTATSTQYSVLVNLNSPQTPRLINLQKASGEVLFTFSPTKTFQSVVFSSPQLATGSYNLYLGGSSTGTPTNGLYTGGTYTPGTKSNTFTISSIVTTIGGGGGFFWP